MSQLNDVAKGALGASLIRNNKQIKEDRGLALWEEIETFYRRKVEDARNKVRRLVRQQASQLDLSPDNTQSLILAKDFDPEKFYDADNSFTMQIRTAKIELQEAEVRYEQLFVNAEAETLEVV